MKNVKKNLKFENLIKLKKKCLRLMNFCMNKMKKNLLNTLYE